MATVTLREFLKQYNNKIWWIVTEINVTLDLMTADIIPVMTTAQTRIKMPKVNE